MSKPMQAGKTVLTTGEVAKICHVAPRTVSKWFDAGHLRGYRIPGSKDRRIPIEQLVRFMRAHGIPLDGISRGATSVLILDADRAVAESIAGALGDVGGFEVATAASALEAGAAAQQFKPQVIVVDVGMPDITPEVVTRFFRSLDGLPSVCLLGTEPGLSDANGKALMQVGFDGYIGKPFDIHGLINLIEQKLGGMADVTQMS